MNYKKTFEDEKFIYELIISETAGLSKKLSYENQTGVWCKWQIQNKTSVHYDELSVTDDLCRVIIFPSVIEAVAGAKQFLSL